jgi:hypothetical protein
MTAGVLCGSCDAESLENARVCYGCGSPVVVPDNHAQYKQVMRSVTAGGRYWLRSCAIRDIWLLRLRALLARAHRDDTAYARFRDHYRDIAKTLGWEGHIA